MDTTTEGLVIHNTTEAVVIPNTTEAMVTHNSTEALVIDVSAPLSQYVFITSIASMVITGLGLIGNGLCCRMMLTSPMKPYSGAIFLLFLSISDSVVLLYEVINDIAVHIDGYNREYILYGDNVWRCRFGFFFYEVAKVISTWLVVALVAELTLATEDPAKRPVINSRNRSFYVSLAASLVSIAGCFPFLVIVSAEEGMNGCTSKYEVFKEVYSHVVLHMFVNCFLPLVIIIVCLGRSIYHLNLLAETNRKSSYDAKKEVVVFQLPKGILSIGIVFILSVTPLTLADLGYFLQRIIPTLRVQEPDWENAHTVCQCLYLLNYAAKFYLLLLLEPNLRNGLSYLSRCGMLKSERSKVYMTDTHHSYSVKGVRAK